MNKQPLVIDSIMGKWVQVRCNCPNRISLPNSSCHDQPYQNSKWQKLSNRKKKEIKTWQENVENRYKCGHVDGMLVQFCPDEIIELGFVLNKVFKDDVTFEIYSKVGEWRNYFLNGLSEELRISPQEAELWLMEVAELEKWFLGQGNLPYHQIQQIILILYQREVRSNNNLKQQFESLEGGGFARIVPFLKNLDIDAKSIDVFLEEKLRVLQDTAKLCQAAIVTGNPIELLW